MKIAMINSPRGYFPAKKGNSISNQVEILSKSLALAGHQVDIFLSDGESKEYKNINLIKYQKYNWEEIVINNDTIDLYSQIRRDFFFNFLLNFDFNNYDIVHVHNLELYLLIDKIENLKTPVIFTVHSDIKYYKSLVGGEYNNLVNNTIFISEWQKELAEEIYEKNFPEERVIYNRIREEYFKQNKDNKKDYFIYFGRISKNKGVDNLFKLIDATDINIKIAGREIKNDILYQEYDVENYFSRENVEYLGELYQDELSEYIANARGLIHLHNWREPFGLSILESVYSGTPVLTSDGGAPAYYLSDKNSVILERKRFDDIEYLKAGFDKLKRISPAECIKSYDERFNFESFGKNYEKIYIKKMGE